MTVKVIPLEACFRLPDAHSPEMRFAPHKVYAKCEREVKDILLREVEKRIHTEDINEPWLGSTVIRASISIADGWGDIEPMARRILELARRQGEMENQERRRALASAEAAFQERFQNAIEEFWGYDECAGRR